MFISLDNSNYIHFDVAFGLLQHCIDSNLVEIGMLRQFMNYYPPIDVCTTNKWKSFVDWILKLKKGSNNCQIQMCFLHDIWLSPKYSKMIEIDYVKAFQVLIECSTQTKLLDGTFLMMLKLYPIKNVQEKNLFLNLLDQMHVQNCEAALLEIFWNETNQKYFDSPQSIAMDLLISKCVSNHELDDKLLATMLEWYPLCINSHRKRWIEWIDDKKISITQQNILWEHIVAIGSSNSDNISSWNLSSN